MKKQTRKIRIKTIDEMKGMCFDENLICDGEKWAKFECERKSIKYQTYPINTLGCIFDVVEEFDQYYRIGYKHLAVEKEHCVDINNLITLPDEIFDL